jgi:hypothetical protein
MPMNGGLSDSSTFLADGLRGGDLPAGVGVGDAETIAAITSSNALIFWIIVFMYFTFLVVLFLPVIAGTAVHDVWSGAIIKLTAMSEFLLDVFLLLKGIVVASTMLNPIHCLIST